MRRAPPARTRRPRWSPPSSRFANSCCRRSRGVPDLPGPTARHQPVATASPIGQHEVGAGDRHDHPTSNAATLFSPRSRWHRCRPRSADFAVAGLSRLRRLQPPLVAHGALDAIDVWRPGGCRLRRRSRLPGVRRRQHRQLRDHPDLQRRRPRRFRATPATTTTAAPTKGIALSGTTLWFAVTGTDNVAAIDTTTLDPSNYNPAETLIPVGFMPETLAATPDGAEVWVARLGPTDHDSPSRGRRDHRHRDGHGRRAP